MASGADENRKAGNPITRLLLRAFGRETSSGNFFPEIDGLRFFAILLVVAFHTDLQTEALWHSAMHSSPAKSWYATLAQQGFQGVPLFFAISGFVLGVPFARHYLNGGPRIGLLPYFMRRLTRIEPPYIIATAILALHSHFAGTAGPLRSIAPHFLASIFYVHHFIFHERPIVYAGWSLEVEVQFYLLAPVLAGVFAIRRKLPRRLVLLGAILLFALAQYRLPPEYHDNLLGQLHYFLIGFLIGDLFLNEWRTGGTNPWRWDLAAACGWVVTLWGAAAAISQLLPTAAVFLIGAAAFRGNLWRRVLRHRVIFTIGGMCYTIYLYHSMILLPVSRETIRYTVGNSYSINAIFQFVLLAGPILGGSAVLFLLFEKPFMRRNWYFAVLRALGIRRDQPTPASPATPLAATASKTGDK